MKRAIFLGLVLTLGGSVGGIVRGDDEKVAKTVLDAAIKAMGGKEKLGGIKALNWKSKGTISFNGMENEFTTDVTVQGTENYHSEFEGDFQGNKFKGVTVVKGNGGWRKFGDMGFELGGDDLKNEKRSLYLQTAPVLIVLLTSADFKVSATGEETLEDKPASTIEFTGPDRKKFKLWFDKASSYPVKMEAKVSGFMGEEFVQETTYSSYKDFGGIKKATKISSKRDGQKFIDQTITEFKVLDKVDPAIFEEPK